MDDARELQPFLVLGMCETVYIMFAGSASGHSIGFVFFGCAGVEKADGIDERMVAHGNNPR